MRSLNAYLWLFAVLALSGLFLMFFYVPTAAPPIPAVPRTGWSVGTILRSVHFWSAQFAILIVLTHLVRVIFVKTKRPYIGWAFGLVLLTCLLWLTGIVLPWDQLAFWLQNWLHGISAQGVLWLVYWTHTLALSLPMLLLLFVYVRRTRRNLAASA